MELDLKRCLLLAYLEGVFPSKKLLLDLLLLQRVPASGTDNGLAASAQYDRVLEEYRVWVFFSILFFVTV